MKTPDEMKRRLFEEIGKRRTLEADKDAALRILWGWMKDGTMSLHQFQEMFDELAHRFTKPPPPY